MPRVNPWRLHKGVIAKGVFSLEESLESLKSLNSLESLENGRIILYFPQSGSSPESLESLNSLESLEMDFSEKTPFPKDPFFRTRNMWMSKEHQLQLSPEKRQTELSEGQSHLVCYHIFRSSDGCVLADWWLESYRRRFGALCESMASPLLSEATPAVSRPAEAKWPKPSTLWRNTFGNGPIAHFFSIALYSPSSQCKEEYRREGAFWRTSCYQRDIAAIVWP